MDKTTCLSRIAKWSLIAHFVALISLYLIDFLSFLLSFLLPRPGSDVSEQSWEYYDEALFYPLFLFYWGGITSYILSVFVGGWLCGRMPLDFKNIVGAAVLVGFVGPLPGTGFLLYFMSETDPSAVAISLLGIGLLILGFGATMGLIGGVSIVALCLRSSPDLLKERERSLPA